MFLTQSRRNGEAQPIPIQSQKRGPGDRLEMEGRIVFQNGLLFQSPRPCTLFGGDESNSAVF